jgi:hypothetical protein
MVKGLTLIDEIPSFSHRRNVPACPASNHIATPFANGYIRGT